MERFASLRVLKIEPHNGVDENKHQEHPEQIHEWTCEQDGTALPEWQRAVLLRLFRGKKILVAGNSARLSFLKPVFSWCAVHIVLVLAAGTFERTPVTQLFEQIVGFLVGKEQVVGNVFHIHGALAIGIAQNTLQVGAVARRSHAANARIAAQRNGSDTEARFSAGEANRGARQTNHEFAYAHPACTCSKIMATFVDEYKKPQKKGYRYEHDEYIHDTHYI